MSAPFASGIILATLSFILNLLLIAPLAWHIRSRNISASALIAWIVVSNFFGFVNPILWPNNDFVGRFHGTGLCDVEAKIDVARNHALPAATLCILKGLADVMNTDKVNLAPSRAQRIRKRAIELGFCIGIPMLSMLLHYIVQYNRYLIFGVAGCFPSVYYSWVSVVLLSVLPLLLSLVAAYYAVLIIVRLRRYRSAFSGMLSASGTTKSRFIRLFILALIFICMLLPISIYTLYLNIPREFYAYSFTAIHTSPVWNTITLLDSTPFALVDRFALTLCGFIVFFTLGFGQEAKTTYRSWMLAMGLGRVFPILTAVPARHAHPSAITTDSTSSSAARLFGRRAKFLIMPQRWSRQQNTGTTDTSLSDLMLKSPVEEKLSGKDVRVVKNFSVTSQESKDEARELW